MDVEKKLRDIGLKPVDGQNFLTNNNTVKALVESGELEEHKTLEIGGGLGVITEKLLENTSELTVVEKDTVLANYLKENFPEAELVNEDALDISFSEFERCISNIPFQITSEIFEKLGDAQVQSSLIVQKELADKAVAEPGDSNYGRFTVMAQYYFLPVKLTDISRREFYPAPEVDASIIKLYPNKERHGVEDEETFFKLVKALFTHKRKKLRNAFVDSRNILGKNKDELKPLRDKIPNSETRVINLGVSELKEIQIFLKRHNKL